MKEKNIFGIPFGFAICEGGFSIAFNPSTNEPYVAYADGGSLDFVIQKFDGSKRLATSVGTCCIPKRFQNSGTPELKF